MRIPAHEAHIGEIKNAELKIKNDGAQDIGMLGKKAREASRRRGSFRFGRAAASTKWKKPAVFVYKEKRAT